jgi:hypothetical protein
MKMPTRQVLLAAITMSLAALTVTACTNPTAPSATPISADGVLNGSGN